MRRRRDRQDAAIAGEADRLGKGIIIAANKWDLMKDRGPEFVKTFDEDAARPAEVSRLRAGAAHLGGDRRAHAAKLLEAIDAVAASRRKRVKTSELNRFVERISAEHPPASPGRRHVRILYAAQTAVAPPTFVFFTNVATDVPLLLPAVPREPAARGVRVRGHADSLQVRARRSRSLIESTEGAARVPPRSRQGGGRHLLAGPDPTSNARDRGEPVDSTGVILFANGHAQAVQGSGRLRDGRRCSPMCCGRGRRSSRGSGCRSRLTRLGSTGSRTSSRCSGSSSWSSAKG